jgi:hypothetical protein
LLWNSSTTLHSFSFLSRIKKRVQSSCMLRLLLEHILSSFCYIFIFEAWNIILLDTETETSLFPSLCHIDVEGWHSWICFNCSLAPWAYLGPTIRISFI